MEAAINAHNFVFEISKRYKLLYWLKHIDEYSFVSFKYLLDNIFDLNKNTIYLGFPKIASAKFIDFRDS